MTFAAIAFSGLVATLLFTARYSDHGRARDLAGTLFGLSLIAVSVTAL